MVSLKRYFLDFEPSAMPPGRRRKYHPRRAYIEALEERQLFAGTATQLIFVGQPSQVAVGGR